MDQTLTVARSAISQDMIDTLSKMKQADVHFGIVSGSDLPKVLEQLSEPVLQMADWTFPENGLQAYKNGELIEKQSFEGFLGKERLEKLVDFCLDYIAKLDIPVKTSVHVEKRDGMINVSPIGRACSRDERNEFERYDHEHKIRQTFVEVLKKEFADYGLRYSIGGQISFDVFPLGWDKSFALRFVEKDYDEIHFWGDKCYEGGNDYEIWKDERTIGHSVKNPEETVAQLKEIFQL